jgi:hypothetical protein
LLHAFSLNDLLINDIYSNQIIIYWLNQNR